MQLCSATSNLSLDDFSKEADDLFRDTNDDTPRGIAYLVKGFSHAQKGGQFMDVQDFTRAVDEFQKAAETALIQLSGIPQTMNCMHVGP